MGDSLKLVAAIPWHVCLRRQESQSVETEAGAKFKTEHILPHPELTLKLARKMEGPVRSVPTPHFTGPESGNILPKVTSKLVAEPARQVIHQTRIFPAWAGYWSQWASLTRKACLCKPNSS